MTETKSRGILFSAPMILALLRGTKTNTRRMMTPQPPNEKDFPGSIFGMGQRRGVVGHVAVGLCGALQGHQVADAGRIRLMREVDKSAEEMLPTVALHLLKAGATTPQMQEAVQCIELKLEKQRAMIRENAELADVIFRAAAKLGLNAAKA